MRVTAVILAGGFLLAPVPSLGQGRRGGGFSRGRKPAEANRSPDERVAPLEEFERMSPEQRTQELAKLPSSRREKLQKQLELYDRLTPQQKAQVAWFNHLPAERQQAFRHAYDRFQKESAEQQKVIREELGRLSALSDAERKARVESPDFKARFNKNQQQILRDMAAGLPGR